VNKDRFNLILFLIPVAIFLAIMLIAKVGVLQPEKPEPPIIRYPYPQPAPLPPAPAPPQQYSISALPIEWIKYGRVVSLMQKWNQEAPEITEFVEYGTTSKGTKCTYLRIGTPGKPKVLITGCIHGNERLSCLATLWIMQKMLHDYGRDKDITWLVKNRDVYWVPALSPDTYLRSRHVEGRDPNRDFPYPGRRAHTPTSPIKNIMNLVKKHKFKGVISGHTTGEIYLWPSIGPAQDKAAHREIAGKMKAISGYSASSISGRPSGYEIDWYYWKGAVAILTEFGSSRHGHNQPTNQIEPHSSKNYKAYMLFIKDSPEVKLKPPS